MVIGDPQSFAIEFVIRDAYQRESLRALGYFVIHACGHVYGVKEPDATMLANSLDEVECRISERGRHTAAFGNTSDAHEIASAYLVSEYEDEVPNETFFELSREQFRDAIYAADLVWAPDGDEAFDDGSHVLQFDIGERVRLIAFKRDYQSRGGTTELQEVWLNAPDFYTVLEECRDCFLNQWQDSPKVDSASS
jgi:hypothetical protein